MLGHGIHCFPPPGRVQDAFSVHDSRCDQIDHRCHLPRPGRGVDGNQLMLHPGAHGLRLAVAQAMHVEHHGAVQMGLFAAVCIAIIIAAVPTAAVAAGFSDAAQCRAGEFVLCLGTAQIIQIPQQGRD